MSGADPASMRNARGLCEAFALRVRAMDVGPGEVMREEEFREFAKELFAVLEGPEEMKMNEDPKPTRAQIERCIVAASALHATDGATIADVVADATTMAAMLPPEEPSVDARFIAAALHRLVLMV